MNNEEKVRRVAQDIKNFSQMRNIPHKEQYLAERLESFDTFEATLKALEKEIQVIEKTLEGVFRDFDPLREDLPTLNENVRVVETLDPEFTEKFNTFRTKSRKFLDVYDRLKEVFKRKKHEFYKTQFEKVLEAFKELKTAIESLQ